MINTTDLYSFLKLKYNKRNNLPLDTRIETFMDFNLAILTDLSVYSNEYIKLINTNHEERLKFCNSITNLLDLPFKMIRNTKNI